MVEPLACGMVFSSPLVTSGLIFRAPSVKIFSGMFGAVDFRRDGCALLFWQVNHGPHRELTHESRGGINALGAFGEMPVQ